MSAAFAVPFNSRYLSPNPEPAPARFETGRRVVWSADREEGFVAAVTDEAVCIHWDESQWTWYPLNSVAAERIVVLETVNQGEGWLS